MDALALGLDFGTESARAVLLDARDGSELASAVHAYEHGVLVDALPTGEALPGRFALQHPADWVAAMVATTRAVLSQAQAEPRRVAGVGVAFTACTILPVQADGTPLCMVRELARRPHAWPKLWKHHAAQPQADAINALARSAGQTWLDCYGGQLSPEWLLPKVLEVLEHAPEIYGAAAYFVEAADWIVWQLTGRLARNACAAGFKATWHGTAGYPAASFLAALRPELADYFATRGAGPVVPPGTPVGTVRPHWTARLGLCPETHVAAGIIDAHAGAIGAGATDPGTLYLAMGTSTCHLLNAPGEQLVPGISGVVKDGIVAGAYAYEAGQAAVGDLFAWQVRQSGHSHEELTARAAVPRAGETGLLAIDWFNGSRTPHADADLTGAILGMTLTTTPADVYRALIEATAYGTRAIVDALEDADVHVGRYVAGGGLTVSRLVMSIYANVLGQPLETCESRHPSARGAAVLGAVAAGRHASVGAAAAAMAPARRRIAPDRGEAGVYDRLYGAYRDLADCLAKDQASPLRRLGAVRVGAAAPQRC